MKRLATAFAATVALTGVAHAGDLIEQVKIYAPINAIALPCALRATDGDANKAMLAGTKSNPEAAKLLARLHRETQASYRAAKDSYGWCDEFAATNSQYVSKIRTEEVRRRIWDQRK